MHTTVQQREDTLCAEVGGEIVLMSHTYDKYYGLDMVGADIWRRIKQPIEVAQLCAGLASDYSGDAATIESVRSTQT
jgi:hypothetical protein